MASEFVTSHSASRCTSVRRLPALLALLLMACSPQSSQSRTDASAARSSVQPQPVACRLPVVSWYQPGPQGNVELPPFGVQGHFVSYPDGTVSPNAADQFTNPDDGFDWRSSARPALRGTGPVGYYDKALLRFLPVPRAQVSPDGRRYVYMDYTQGWTSTSLVSTPRLARCRRTASTSSTTT
jgi:hypothetical protein